MTIAFDMYLRTINKKALPFGQSFLYLLSDVGSQVSFQSERDLLMQ
jgi:hypothetical protein